nr:hypothetical protein [Campylobacter sp.]
DGDSISIINSDNSNRYTKVTYKNPTEKYQNKIEFDIDKLKKDIFFNLLPLFIEYNNNNINLTIKINDEIWLNAESIKSELSKYKFEEKEFELVGKNNIRKEFKLYYTISHDNNGNIKQFYAAAYRKVKEFSKIVKIEKLPNKASGTFCLVSDYFNDLVDDSRENFRLKENENNETDEFPIVFPNINKKLKETLNSIIIEKFPNIKDEFAKTKKKIINKKPYLRRYIDKMNDFTISEKTMKDEAEKEFNKQFGETKEKIEKFANEILKTKNFNKERYDEIVNNFTEVGQEQLAHYFAYRQTIIDMLKNIYETNLNLDNKFKEADIHDLIMPRKNISDNYLSNIPKNNIWIFDDKFMTFNFVASDLEMQ